MPCLLQKSAGTVFLSEHRKIRIPAAKPECGFLVDVLFIVLQADGDHAAHALLLHCDAVECVAALHGALAVGDDDELRTLRILRQIIGEITDVGGYS